MSDGCLSRGEADITAFSLKPLVLHNVMTRPLAFTEECSVTLVFDLVAMQFNCDPFGLAVGLVPPTYRFKLAMIISQEETNSNNVIYLLPHYCVLRSLHEKLCCCRTHLTSTRGPCIYGAIKPCYRATWCRMPLSKREFYLSGKLH